MDYIWKRTIYGKGNQTAALLNESEETIVKWHERLGHLNFNDV